ncbi:hypothetical protein P154DRAFT_500811 [Amniculicola lignicola CBS 123094]|uniref:Galactose oxidase n=1 Tax=Amniculicola lignicola CBS 123094 TaxID=1392246 RepID=A0A6A5VZU3_9PLEO|nr:hypothetical protein P154DRAFT_500811 [Amniculicola lignicola CBS 123094]
MRTSFAPSIVLRPSCAVLHGPVFWLAVLISSAMAQMPYNPTRILQNGTLLYVFQPAASSSAQFELGSIDVSSKVAAADLPYTTLNPSLPFLDASNPRAFTPILDNAGNMTVYTGDCAEGAKGAKVWNYMPNPSDKSGKGTWQQQGVRYDEDDKHVEAIGSNYLNAGMAFSGIVDGDGMDTSAYFFGGMCPTQNSGDDWQSAANYSNLMVTLEPLDDSTQTIDYQIGVSSSSRGPPIAEAGFTLTGLSPSFSNRSDGTLTQQQNFVLVGGHTSAAFINMSQVALFSLPEQGWTFIPILQPDTERSDLAVRADVQEVEPRSGHSAVLTPDGQQIVVFGGWIGDVQTPASPQLAVLNLGEGYGGLGAWEWTIPETSGSGLADGSGLYGHGAAMLPGGVMIITGGYSISKPSSKWRRAGQESNTRTMLFNVTSKSWITEYTPPATPSSSEPQQSGPLSKPSQKAGLGAGLGVGMAAILGLMVFYLWYTRRMKRQRETRESHLRELAMSAHRYNIEGIPSGIDGRGGHIDAGDYLDGGPNDAYFFPTAGQNATPGWRRSQGHDVERTGLLVEIPSPTRGLRRSLSGRQGHQLMAQRVRGAGDIHPIDELEEESEAEHANDKTPLNSQPEMEESAGKKRASIFENAPVLDPFTDTNRSSVTSQEQRELLLHSAPASPVREVAEDPTQGPSDWHLALAALLPRRYNPGTGRTSPTRSDRTESNLSDSSRSNFSSHSASGSLGRSMSMRSAAMLNHANNANPFTTPGASPTTRSHASNTEEEIRTRSITSVRSQTRPNTGSCDTDSFTTARSSFVKLQAEGEALLGGNPERARPGTSSTSNGSNTQTYQDTEPSMTRSGTVTPTVTEIPSRYGRERRKSWLGSVRRVLARSTTGGEPRTRSLTTSTPQLEAYHDDPTSPTLPSSPTHQPFPVSAPPRRAASDASFWQSKRGRQDWLDDELDENDPGKRWKRNSGDNWGAPEDEALAEKERRRRKWRERSTHLISLSDDEGLGLPPSRSPIRRDDLGSPPPQPGPNPLLSPAAAAVGLGIPDPTPDIRPSTPATLADEDDWDVEAAIERRVVQVMFTVPKTKLRVVNADVDRSSVLSLPRDDSGDRLDKQVASGSNSPSRVRDLAGRFELMTGAGSPGRSQRPSPSPSLTSLKVRKKGSGTTMAAAVAVAGSVKTPLAGTGTRRVSAGSLSVGEGMGMGVGKGG